MCVCYVMMGHHNIWVIIKCSQPLICSIVVVFHCGIPLKCRDNDFISKINLMPEGKTKALMTVLLMI